MQLMDPAANVWRMTAVLSEECDLRSGEAQEEGGLSRDERSDDGWLRDLFGYEATFIPGDPPRTGRFALFQASAPVRRAISPDALQARTGAVVDELEVIFPAGRTVRRRIVSALFLSVDEALPLLLGIDRDSAAASVIAWSTTLTAGLGLIARGRIIPAVTPGGHDGWRTGPLDPGDNRLLEALAAALPPVAFALRLDGRSPLRLRSPAVLIRSVWDALADVLPRSPAAPLIAGTPLFSASEPQDAAGLEAWLAEAGRGLEGGAQVALRVELDNSPAVQEALERPEGESGTAVELASAARDGSALVAAGQENSARATLQLTSRADPSLVVDARDLFASPAAVLARFGDDAETDLLLALRRGARAWKPLESLLRERVPGDLALGDDDVADLLGDGAAALQGAGIEVLWPTEIVTDGLALRAAVTAAPGAVVSAGLDLKTLLEFRWQVTLAGELLTDDELDQLAEAKRGLVRIRGRWIAADPALLARLRRRRSRRLSMAEALGALLAGEIEIDGERVPIVAGGSVATIADRLRSLADTSSVDLPAPPGLAAELRPYQQRGVAWLHQMCELRIGGCLADDMGLGKTIQVIALHLHRKASKAGPTLVICPTSLLGNWERELHRFAPGVPVRRYHGGGRHLDEIAADEVVLATYGVVRRDHSELAGAGFSLVVADEAQQAKNPLSGTARALRAIPAEVRIALSGTPVENRLTELWSILDWTTPGLLGPLERFRRTVALPIERYRDPAETERLANVVRPFLLRRRKTDPAIAPDLPPRTVTDHAVALSIEQTTLYEAEVREALSAIAAAEGMERRGLVLRLLTVLKQICNHPAQYLHQHGPLSGRSGKLAALEDLIEVILAEKESILVFSQYVEMCSLIEARLAALGVATVFLHGGVPAKKRDEMVAAFQAGEAPIFLLSLKAGGLGLNLTKATHVVHYDRWWNPAVEDQATDRAHRIGQKRSVQVHRFVAEGTLEDRIAELLERKRSLAEAVIGEGEAWLTELSNDQLAELVRLGGGE